MVFSTAVRYQLVRLRAISRPLRRPTVGGPLALLGLLAVVVPQYLQNPEWRGQYNSDVDSPAPGADAELGALSSEDLADLAEIDNLSLLLNQLQPVTATALAPPANSARLALPEATSEPELSSPFAQYLERSRFRFSPATSGETTSKTDSGAAAVSSQPSPFALAPAVEERQPSPLQQALNQRLSATTDTAARAEGTSPEPAAPSGLTPSPWMVEGSLPGVDQRFIRTTPQMSPPPGTTGYTIPPRLAPGRAMGTPAQGAIAPAGLNLDFAAPGAASVGAGQGPAQPPAVDNGPSSMPPPATAPFSAPRPPGVYTGNGYINTFSDPSGPVD